jgi:hypothetical protein
MQLKAKTRLGAFLLTANLAAFFILWLLGQWPLPHLSPLQATLLALAGISAAVLTGLAIASLWRPSRLGMEPPPSFSASRLIATCAAGWVWVPAVVLLSRQHSSLAMVVAAVASIVMAATLRTILFHSTANAVPQPRELFANYLCPPTREWNALMTTLCLYAAFFALHRGAFCIASFLLAVSVFLFTWKFKGDRPSKADQESRRATILRFSRIASVALVVTALLLLLPRQHGFSAIGADAFDQRSQARNVAHHSTTGSPIADISGYRRIILWPAPEKKKLVVPLLSNVSSTGFNPRKPLTIRFDGSYWYYQPRYNALGTRAHVARGSPESVDIHSANRIPLIMEAHQLLAAPVPLSCCREMHVSLKNYDNARGLIGLGVLLTDSTSIGRPTLYLEQQTIASTEPDHFTIKSSPATETLSYRLPVTGKIHQFDQITVVFFPDTQRPYTAPRITIEQFELIPR